MSTQKSTSKKRSCKKIFFFLSRRSLFQNLNFSPRKRLFLLYIQRLTRKIKPKLRLYFIDFKGFIFLNFSTPRRKPKLFAAFYIHFRCVYAFCKCHFVGTPTKCTPHFILVVYFRCAKMHFVCVILGVCLYFVVAF